MLGVRWKKPTLTINTKERATKCHLQEMFLWLTLWRLGLAVMEGETAPVTTWGCSSIGWLLDGRLHAREEADSPSGDGSCYTLSFSRKEVCLYVLCKIVSIKHIPTEHFLYLLAHRQLWCDVGIMSHGSVGTRGSLASSVKPTVHHLKASILDAALHFGCWLSVSGILPLFSHPAHCYPLGVPSVQLWRRLWLEGTSSGCCNCHIGARKTCTEPSKALPRACESFITQALFQGAVRRGYQPGAGHGCVATRQAAALLLQSKKKYSFSSI